ncbi:MAG: hypothetical protein ABSG28_07625 [Methanoregula sp.]
MRGGDGAGQGGCICHDRRITHRPLVIILTAEKADASMKLMLDD